LIADRSGHGLTRVTALFGVASPVAYVALVVDVDRGEIVRRATARAQTADMA